MSELWPDSFDVDAYRKLRNAPAARLTAQSLIDCLRLVQDFLARPVLEPNELRDIALRLFRNGHLIDGRMYSAMEGNPAIPQNTERLVLAPTPELVELATKISATEWTAKCESLHEDRALLTRHPLSTVATGELRPDSPVGEGTTP